MIAMLTVLTVLALAAVGLRQVLHRESTPREELDIWGVGSDAAQDTPAPQTQDGAGEAPRDTPGAAGAVGGCAVWISYLEWESVDFSTQEAFTQEISTMLANCAALGADSVIVQVRPFGDALYRSDLFPASHLLTGTQGQGVDYDPLQLLITGAHAAGLKLEAWLNPYRVRLDAKKPAVLSPDNPAVRWMADPVTANFVRTVGDGIYYDPGQPAVRQLIEDGVRELVENYDVDGIVLDDYFYPTTDASFDADTYAAYGGGLSLDDWRRGNVDLLVSETYALIKDARPDCSFGISPSGNLANNLQQQYSDVTLWLAQPGYVDYLMPQIYWGFDYVTAGGSTAFAFENCLADWAALPRCEGVGLRVALGAYRIGDGDGGAADSTEWSSGDNLARQAMAAALYTDGFSLYRYDFLYKNTAYPDLTTKELAALQTVLSLREGWQAKG